MRAMGTKAFAVVRGVLVAVSGLGMVTKKASEEAFVSG
jgi:hypothetical protein